MRHHFFVALLAIFLTACAGSKVDQEVTLNRAARENTPNRSVNAVTERDSGSEAVETTRSRSAPRRDDRTLKEAVAETMEFLASDELQGRKAGTEGIAMAADYIETVFESHGIRPYFSTYKDTLSNYTDVAYNIVGYLEGQDPLLKQQVIIVGAHYDHIGQIEADNGDSIANGANDNASGTTVVLELAKHFGRTRNNRRSMMFVLFSAEEQGLLGSKHLADRLGKRDLNLYLMLNFEMVGVPLRDKDYFMYVTGYQNSNLADVCNRYAGERLVGFLPAAGRMNLFQRSDNYPFYEAFQIPAQTFSTFDFTNFDQYHKVGDENGLMDFDHMAGFIRKTLPMAEGLVNAPNREVIWHQ